MESDTPQSNNAIRRRLPNKKTTPPVENKPRSTLLSRENRLTSLSQSRRRVLQPSPTQSNPPESITSNTLEEVTVKSPRSPRDQTPLILEGQEIKREDIPPIIIPEDPSPSPELIQEDLEIKPASPERDESPISPEIPILHNTTPVPQERHVPILVPSASPSPKMQSQTMTKTPTRVIVKRNVTPKQESPHKRIPDPGPTPIKQNPPEPGKKPASNNKEKKVPPKPPVAKRTKKAQPRKLQPPDFVKMGQTQRVEALVRYRKRFMNLRDTFPGLGIRKIPEDLEPTPDNLLLIHTEYDGYMTHILISEDVSQSMIILVIVLGGIELFLTKVCGLPAGKYVIKQFKLIHKYRSLLYELGEEKIANSGGSSPPLARLIYLILLTSIATVGIRLLESTIGKMGSNMAEDIIYGLLGGGGADAPSDDPTENAGGFDLNSLLKMAGGFLGGGGNQSAAPKQETRGPAYNE